MKTKVTRMILFLSLFIPSIGIVGQTGSNENNILLLKGEDFPTQKSIVLRCDTSGCWTIHRGEKNILEINLFGKLDEKTVHLQIEAPAKKGNYKMKLDADADQKPGEKIFLEIYGSNKPVDNSIYTLEIKSDEASIQIKEMNEETGKLFGTVTAKFFNGTTGVKRAGLSLTFNINKK